MPRLYEPTQKQIHNQSAVTGDEILCIETPPQQWAYAVSVPPKPNGLESGRFRTTLQVRVHQGAIGIGTLTQNERAFHDEVQVAATDQWTEVTVLTGMGTERGPLVVRNLSGTGKPSRAEIMIVDSVPTTAAATSAETTYAFPEIFIDDSIFARFHPWSGEVPRGYWADWTGTLTRADVWAFPAHIRALYDQDRFEATTTLPLSDEHVLDWVPLIQAVLSARSTFRMAALGAGWGRWIAAGAMLARHLGIDCKVLGVEAEPQHFSWMVRHMQDNAIGPDCAILINAAAAGRPDDCWFQVGNSQAWYGQSIAPIDAADKGEFFEGPQGQLRRTKAITLTDLLGRLSPIDYLHMDIQGSEAEFLRYAPDELDQEVESVNIGTHSHQIEADLRDLFTGLGWTSVYDVPLGGKRQIRVGDKLFPQVNFGDGVQVWANPKFSELKRTA